MSEPSDYDKYLASIGAVWGCECGCGGTEYSDYTGEDEDSSNPEDYYTASTALLLRGFVLACRVDPVTDEINIRVTGPVNGNTSSKEVGYTAETVRAYPGGPEDLLGDTFREILEEVQELEDAS